MVGREPIVGCRLTSGSGEPCCNLQQRDQEVAHLVVACDAKTTCNDSTTQRWQCMVYVCVMMAQWLTMTKLKMCMELEKVYITPQTFGVDYITP